MNSNIATEPREFWINVFHDQYTHHQIAHNSRNIADACAKNDSEHRVDCIHVREVAPSVSTETKPEPASGKFKMSIFEELLDASQDAADFMSTSRIGSQEYEMSIRLQLAIERAAK